MQPVTGTSIQFSPERQRRTADELLQILQSMGARASNPVLELLGDVRVLREKQRYPAKALRFAGAGLRAYYHCHPGPEQREGEHGHFHLFLRVPPATQESWSHLAGLAMDHEGQALRWFTVNRWVSGGPWTTADALCLGLDRLSTPTRLSPVEHWLMTMLRLHRTEVQALLLARDQATTQFAAVNTGCDPLENRQIYELSEKPVDIMRKLQGLLGDDRQPAKNRFQEVSGEKTS